MDFRVTGADELTALARRARAAGGSLPKELRAGLQKAAKPAEQAARQAALEELPKAGGLNERVAAGKFTATVRLSGTTASLTVTAQAGMDLESLDRGKLRHPVYGNRSTWVLQNIPAGWFSRRMEAEADRIVEPVVQAGLNLLDKL